MAVGTVLQSELDGLISIDKISIKCKAKILTQIRNQVKVNDKSVAVDPLKCFNRLVLVADRQTTMIRKSDEAALGRYQEPTVISDRFGSVDFWNFGSVRFR